jgi:hypothetical protein
MLMPVESRKMAEYQPPDAAGKQPEPTPSRTKSGFVGDGSKLDFSPVQN